MTLHTQDSSVPAARRLDRCTQTRATRCGDGPPARRCAGRRAPRVHRVRGCGRPARVAPSRLGRAAPSRCRMGCFHRVHRNSVPAHTTGKLAAARRRLRRLRRRLHGALRHSADLPGSPDSTPAGRFGPRRDRDQPRGVRGRLAGFAPPTVARMSGRVRHMTRGAQERTLAASGFDRVAVRVDRGGRTPSAPGPAVPIPHQGDIA